MTIKRKFNWSEEHSYWQTCQPPQCNHRQSPNRPPTPVRVPRSPTARENLKFKCVASPPVRLPGIRTIWYYVRNTRQKREYFRWKNRERARRLQSLHSSKLPTPLQAEISQRPSKSSQSQSLRTTLVDSQSQSYRSSEDSQLLMADSSESVSWNESQSQSTGLATMKHPKPTANASRSSINEARLEKMIQSRWDNAFDANFVNQIYNHELLPTGFNLHKVVRLEFSQYLENYLWKNFKLPASKEFVISIAVMVNEKCRERISAFNTFVEHPTEWTNYFRRILELILDPETPFIEKNILLTFLTHCTNSMEIELVRLEVMNIASLLSWKCLSENKREAHLKTETYWRKAYNKTLKLEEAKSEDEKTRSAFNSRFLWRLMQRFKRVLDDLDSENETLDPQAISFVEKVTLLIIELQAQLSTRRFLHVLVDASQIIVHATLSGFYLTEPGTLFFKLMQMLIFYFKFEVDNSTGEPLSIADIEKKHYELVQRLQVCAFKNFRERSGDFCLLSVGNVNSRLYFEKLFDNWTADDLYQLAYELNLVCDRDDASEVEQKSDLDYLKNAKYLREIIIFHCTKPQFQLDKINAQPLYPNEEVIWDENLVPYEEYNGDGILPLSRLNLQFLTFHDYLLRNFNLFQMESTYEIRHDLEDVLFRVRPWKHEIQNTTVWGGWARMALPITTTRIVTVAKPFVGETAPSEVKIDVDVNLPKRIDLRREWEQLRRNDVLFLLTILPTEPVGTKFDVRKPFKEQFKVTSARGCEIEGLLGADGKPIDEMDTSALRELTGDVRTYRVRLDPNQYQQDTDKADLYYSFNLLVRRDPKANNFKAVLSTIRQLLNTKCVVPDWLNDVLLGYGDPSSAHYSKRVGTSIATLDFNDTFLDFDHLKESFPNAEIRCDVPEPKAPFQLTFNELVPQHGQEQKDTSILVECPSVDPVQKLLGIKSRQNSVRFTPAQIEAIKSGMEPGLTMVVGPPGTGKTDVAVQIISNIYHNWPEERTLIVTHSNQALNQLFEKIIALDVDERHLLRLGHGEEALKTSKDFSRYGRVNYVLKERLELLKLITKLKEVTKAVGDVDATCETAGYFYRYTIIRSWEDFLEEIESRPHADAVEANCTKENNAVDGQGDGQQNDEEQKPITNDFIAKNFPFREFFENADELFQGKDLAEDLERAQAAFEYIQQIFAKLDEFRAFELLRNGRERSDYLLVREAKVIAMTCTHAALRRKELVELGFCYDNVIMEEAAQILEVETFIPLLLQEPSEGVNRLKRWIMIGDHHQLPPVVQNVAYQKYSNLEQSLFGRFIRLGVPHIQLDAQGRARAEIASLYNWRYEKLGNLPHVLANPEYQRANPGFKFPYQFIDVPDFNGVGESTPSPYFYQNLGEAEYAVALFTYMRILGYPAERISILTTYNGQRSLLMDVLTRRCQSNPLIGMPSCVSTVDKYQGQQNDYVILSLVRTKLVGHLRDVRRLVVAVSRARLGLYILGRQQLFQRCLELAPVFKKLSERSNHLQLFPAESFESDRLVTDLPSEDPVEIIDAAHMANFVVQFYTSNLDFLKAKHERAMLEKAAAEMQEQEEDETMEVEETSAQPESTEQPPTTTNGNVAKRGAEHAEGVILFEQVDFERLENPPNYGS
ncbi:hypothetical protein M3Y94_00720700 [Aphelenchoides besseyi]|nr:hypothetical protein M3Y94_00720700 [Aphelenchoides besseyi]KAI6231799.1 hypothetical protein M3Y95_00419500 [Aphelenchoides besseyi]